MELLVKPEQAGRTVKSLLKGELGLSTARIARLKRTETGLTPIKIGRASCRERV